MVPHWQGLQSTSVLAYRSPVSSSGRCWAPSSPLLTQKGELTWALTLAEEPALPQCCPELRLSVWEVQGEVDGARRPPLHPALASGELWQQHTFCLPLPPLGSSLSLCGFQGGTRQDAAAAAAEGRRRKGGIPAPASLAALLSQPALCVSTCTLLAQREFHQIQILSGAKDNVLEIWITWNLKKNEIWIFTSVFCSVFTFLG